MTYRLSSAGRWKIGALLAATLLLWVLALVMLAGIWALRWFSTPAAPSSLTEGQAVPAYLFLAMILAGPPLAWDLLTELTARYTVEPAGLRFQALGLNVQYPWEAARSIRRTDQRGGAAGKVDVLFDTPPRTSLVRMLHPQSYGRSRVPIYADVLERDSLLATIRQQITDPETSVQ